MEHTVERASFLAPLWGIFSVFHCKVKLLPTVEHLPHSSMSQGCSAKCFFTTSTYHNLSISSIVCRRKVETNHVELPTSTSSAPDNSAAARSERSVLTDLEVQNVHLGRAERPDRWRGLLRNASSRSKRVTLGAPVKRPP